MYDLKQGSKEQLIADFLQPENQPQDYLDSPTYKGLQYLLEAHLNDCTYYVYDPEVQVNEGAAKFVEGLHENHKWELLAHLKIGDTYHFVNQLVTGAGWSAKPITVVAVSYHGSPFLGAQTIYFIREL